VPIAPGASGANIQTQRVGPAGVPIAPGPAGTLGSDRVGTPRGPSSTASSGCAPGTTGGGNSVANSARADLGPTANIMAPEPGRPNELTPNTRAGSAATTGTAGPATRC
jgi:hypothetical protein